MPTPIPVPDLGAGDQVIRVSTWLAEIGERVEAGDRLVELLLPGITFDVAVPVSGRLVRIEKFMDAAVQPGDIIGWIEREE